MDSEKPEEQPRKPDRDPENNRYVVEHADGSGSVVYHPREHDVLPRDPQLERPEPLDPDCPECGARDTVICVKPVRNSGAWWDDPYPYWICASCHKIAFDTMDVHLWQEYKLGHRSTWKLKGDA